MQHNRYVPVVFLTVVFILLSVLTDQTALAEPIVSAESSRPATLTTGTITLGMREMEAHIMNAPLPPDIQRIKDRGKLIVVMHSIDQPPFFYTDEHGELAGVEVEMAWDNAQLLGVTVEFDRAAPSFPQGREKSVLELMRDVPFKVAVLQGTSYIEYARELFPSAQLVLVEDTAELVEAAAKGEVFAGLYDEFEIKTYMGQHPSRNIELRTVAIRERLDPIAMAVAPHDEHLLAWLNTYLAYGTSHLRLQELQREYFRTPIR